MRAVLIDPVAKTVTDITLAYKSDGGDGGFVELRKHIGCETIESVRLGHRSVAWVDDEALLKDKPGPFWTVVGAGVGIIGGRGVVTGLSEDGDTVDCSLPARLLAKLVSFPDVEFVGFKDSREEDVEIAPGIVGTRFRREALFQPKGGSDAA